MIPVVPGVEIDEGLIEERFIRSPGPGGQNVNKVSTGVQLRFEAAKAFNLPPKVRHRLIELAGSRASLAGVITIEATRFRERERNREDAMNRLIDLVRRAAFRPKPRIATRPSRASKERRIQQKTERGRVKRLRGPIRDQDA